MTNNIMEEIDKFKRNISNLETQIDSLIVDDKEMDNQYYELRTNTVRETLVKIFGEEQETENKGLINNLFDYTDTNNFYKDAVLFSHWTFKGLPHQYHKEDKRDFRVNQFYKGNRWSNEKTKETFYMFFKEIKKACQNDVPIDFFSRWGINKGIRYIYISTGTNNLDCSIDIRNNTATIKLPMVINHNGQIKSEKFKNLLTFIVETKNKIDDPNKAKAYYSTEINRLNGLTAEFQDALAEFKSKDSKLLAKWVEPFKSPNTAISNDIEEKVFNVILSYQYHDIPYNIRMFLPEIKEKKESIEIFELPLSCFAISLTANKTLSEDYKKVFMKLSDILEASCTVDKLIWEKHAENLLIYNEWQNVYNLIHEKYYRLALLVESICHAVCKNVPNSKQTDYTITKRVKSLESLYSKIASKINKNKDTRISIGELMLTPNSQDQNPIDKVLEIIEKLEIKDIAGIRIICKYDDTTKIKEEIENNVLNNNGDLKRIGNGTEYSTFDEKNPEFYRSIHIWVSPGKTRKGLYEVKDIHNLIAEIQIRSTLAQGWADVSHEVYYKPKLPKGIAKKHKDEIRNDLKTESVKLEQIDKKFTALRDIYTNRRDNFREESKKGIK